MRKVLAAVVLVVALTVVGGCKLQTPEIRGVVLDAETKEPVEGAWVRATIDLETKTVAGKVQSTLTMDEPHTRTDKQGRFVIPSKSFKKPPIPVGFGTEVLSVAIGAGTVDEIGGRVNYYGGYKERAFGKGAGDLNELLAKKSVELIIYAKPYERIESEYFSRLQSLYKYCSTGRSSVEMPPVEGGCDAWELDFAITQHERYLERYKEEAEKGKVKGYFSALEQLSLLYEKKGSLERAIEPLRRTIALMEKRGLLKFENWQRDKADIEHNIKRLEQLLQNKHPQP